MDSPVWIKYWTVWAVALILILLAFLIPEFYALAKHVKGGTLSESVWHLRDTGQWLYWLILDVVTITAITMAWLLIHFRIQGGRFAP